jgi:hypothetical protein
MSRELRDRLLNELLPMARELLESRGEFLPFAGAIAPDGQTKLIAGTSGRDHPETLQILDVLVAGLAEGARAGQYLVTGLCFLASVEQGVASDAICIEFEDAESEPSSVVTRFVRDGEFVDFGEITLMRCARRVFKKS